MLVGIASLASFILAARALAQTTSPCTTTVTAYSEIASATAACSNIVLSSINVPAKQTLDLSSLQNAIVTFSGTTTFEYAAFSGNLIEVGGSNFTITSEPGAVIDGNGGAWWDGQGSNGGGIKPDHFFTVKSKGGALVENLYIQNYPVHCFSISGTDLVMQGITLNNSAGNAPNNASGGLPAAHNTDGFDIGSSTNMIIQNNTVINQDDCVAVTSGSNITVRGMYCDGSHGLSIGSVGGKSNNNVTSVLFQDSIVKNSQNGARIKTNSNTTGYVDNIVWENILLSNISIYGIDVQQDYLNGGPTSIPTNGVEVHDIVFKNITGTVISKARDYYILCGSGSCANITFVDVNIIGGMNDSCNFGNLC